MVRKLGLFLVLVMGLGLTSCAAQGTEIEWVYSLDEGLRIARQENKPIMVDFYTDWCGWCKKLDQDTYSNPEVQELAEEFVCVKVDGDSDRSSVSRYGIRGYPTILFLDSNGEEIDRNVGYAGPDELAQMMRRIPEE